MQHSHWPAWRYGPNGEGAVFESEADVPKGWHDHPSKHEKAEAPKAAPPSPSKPKSAAKSTGKKAGRPAKAKPAAPLDL